MNIAVPAFLVAFLAVTLTATAIVARHPPAPLNYERRTPEPRRLVLIHGGKFYDQEKEAG